MTSHISEVVGSAVRRARGAAGSSRDAVAEAVRAAGGPESFTAHALANVETGRPDDRGVRRRDVTVDEVLWLATALKVTPAVLLGQFAEAFGAAPPAEPAECLRCAGRSGPVESAVRDDVDQLGDLSGIEPSLAQAAYRLAAAMDQAVEDRPLPGLAKELRATLTELMGGRDGDDDDGLGDLGTPD